MYFFKVYMRTILRKIVKHYDGSLSNVFAQKKRTQMFRAQVHESYVYLAFVYTSLACADQENGYAVFLGKLIFNEYQSIFSTVVDCESKG